MKKNKKDKKIVENTEKVEERDVETINSGVKTEAEIKKMIKKMGRPTKYSPLFAKKLIDFANRALTKTRIITITTRSGAKIEKEEEIPNRFPTLEAFTWQNDISDDSCVIWAGAKTKSGKPKYPDFLAAYNHLKKKQKEFLIENGLNGKYPSNFAIFVAQNFTEMREKIVHEGSKERPLVVKHINYKDDSPDAPRPKRVGGDKPSTPLQTP